MVSTCMHRHIAWYTRFGAGVYTEAPSESTQTLLMHPDAPCVYTPGQRLGQKVGAVVYTDTPSDSTQTTFVDPYAV